MSAYTIYKELFPSQTVEHVEQAQFITPGRTNLIVAKASLLQIYDFVEYTPNTSQPAPDDALRTQEDPTKSNHNDDDDDDDDKVKARGEVYLTSDPYLIIFSLGPLFPDIDTLRRRYSC